MVGCMCRGGGWGGEEGSASSIAHGARARDAHAPTHPPHTLPPPPPHRCTRILPILMPLQQARSAFSMLSPLRMMDTPHKRLQNSTPT